MGDLYPTAEQRCEALTLTLTLTLPPNPNPNQYQRHRLRVALGPRHAGRAYSILTGHGGRGWELGRGRGFMGRTAWGEGAEVACGTRETTSRRRRKATMEAVQEPQHSGLLSYGMQRPQSEKSTTNWRVSRGPLPSLSFDSVRYAANDCFAHHLYDRYYRGYL